MLETAVFFGCWRQAGHCYWTPGMGRVRLYGVKVTPWGNGIDSKIWYRPMWSLLQLAGWTAVGRSDNTVDSRPGSIAVFCFPAVLTLDAALEQARTTFPEVWRRLFPADSPPGSRDREEP